MCVAILCKPGAILTDTQLNEGWNSNSHGAGFAFVNPETNKVQVQKGFMKRDEFMTAYKAAAAQYSADTPFLVHMRIRSAGDSGPKNTHPFRVKNGAMIHNGTMFSPTGERAGKEGDRYSDTRVFATTLHNVLDLESVKRAEKGILNEIGATNKLVFLYDDKQYYIVNESSGIWEDNIWYSNSYSCKVGPHWAKRR